MNEAAREAVLLALTDSMRKHDSWCGETHLQKATYFLQEAAGVPLSLEYILYRYGPFSFELREELTTMRANVLLALEPALEYGPRFKPTEAGVMFRQLCEEEVKPHESSIEFVSSWLGPMGVKDLERVATALYVIRKHVGKSDAQQAEYLATYKPHISREIAVTTIQEVKSRLTQYTTVR